jgi:hypothetical protein
VAHAHNPSYLGGRDQEDHSLKTAWANSLQNPILKNPITKNWAGGVSQGEGPEFKVQYCKKKQKKKRKCHGLQYSILNPYRSGLMGVARGSSSRVLHEALS